VYKVDQTVITGTGGLVTIPDLEWDSYSLVLPTSSSIDVAGSWPFMPIAILPGTTTNVIAVVKAASTNSLLIQITNEQRLPLAAAVAQLTGHGVTATQSAGVYPYGDQSQVYFSSLGQENYTVVIEAPGYATMSGEVAVDGDSLERFMIATESAAP
jgi:hypothetical protein